MLKKSIVYTALFSIILALIVGGIFATLPNDTWQLWQPATCFQTNCFCEAVQLSSAIRQPVNAWSSLAFAFGGIYILCAVFFGRKNDLYTDVFSYMLGIASIIVGLGSAFYHASLTFTGQFFDIFGMYLVTSLMLVYALKRLYQWSMARAISTYLILNVVLTLIQLLIPETRRYIFAVVLIAALAFELVYITRLKPAIQTKWLTIGLGLFAFAFFVWVLDNTRTLCAPESVLQNHALWHILGAVALLFLDRYYDSETKKLDINPSLNQS